MSFVPAVRSPIRVGRRNPFARGTSSAAPAPPAPSSTLPSSPAMLEQTGSLVGQVTVLFWKPAYTQGGAAISTAPVTGTTVYLSSSWANAEAGVFTYSAAAGTLEQVTVNPVAAGTWYVWAVSTNASGPSDRSHILTVVVT